MATSSKNEKEPTESSSRRPDALLQEATWDGPDDPANPYNWPTARKISVGLVCSISQLVTTMSASMVVPALDRVLEDLGMSTSSGQVAFSVFFLGLGFAPFLVAPLAEMYGRRRVWLAGNAVYVVWNSLCPVGFSPALMIVGRLLSGAGASVGVTLTGPVLADMYGAEDRGKATAIAGLLPYIGPAAGPIIGGLAAQRLWWPWLFWILSIFDAVGMTVGFIVVRESYGPVLLQRKAQAAAAAAAARLAAANETLESKPQPWYRASAAYTASSWHDFSRRFVPAIQTPIRLLLFRPVVPLIALSMALLFGTYTILLSAFAPMWLDPPYNQSPTTASLHYIAIAIGAFACAQAGGPLMDWLWRRQRDADAAADPASAPTPEYRLPYMATGFIVAVAGLFWYAWAAERAAHWALIDAGVLLFTLGDFMFSQGLFAYLIDEFPSRTSASANAASRIGTYTLGFAFPIFSPSLYDRLGYGWGNSLLAFLLAAIGGAVLLVLWKWGPKIRSLGRGDSNAQEQVSTV